MMSDGQEPPQKLMKVASPAWDFLEEFIVDEKEKQSVKDLLEQIEVKTIVALKGGGVGQWIKISRAAPKSDIMGDDFTSRIETPLNAAVEAHLAQRPAAEILCNKALNENAANLEAHSVNTSVPSISKNAFSTQSRVPILVLGSSGSGKTTFVARGLKRLLQDSLPQDQGLFTVYLDASSVREVENKPFDASRVIEKVKGIIMREAKILVSEESPIKGILMVVIIDEVGLKCDSLWAGTKASLDDLTAELKRHISPDGVQLVLAGTGLDSITSLLNSTGDCIKIRMQPWKFEAVQWWADNCVHFSSDEEKGRILGIISSTPVLKALTTNARAIRFLLESLALYGEYVDNNNALIAHAVTTVAFKYITTNGLKDLTPSRRRRVAKLALKTLSEAGHGQALQPDCFFEEADKSDRNIRRAFFALVETHVENQTLIADQEYAVSVSPAVSIVLVALMGCISILSSSWSEFETVAALSELQRCFVVCEKGDCTPRLLRSLAPFPPANALKKLRVPILDNCTTVVVNGPLAPYADVVGHRRLLQCKYSRLNGAVKVNLKNELAKLGVLKPEHYAKGEYLQGRFLTNRLMVQWKQVDARHHLAHAPAVAACAPSDDKASDKKADSLLKYGWTRSMYPMGQLQVNQGPPDELRWKEYTLNGECATHEDSECPWDLDASFDQEITVVFCTNQSQMAFNIHKRTPFTLSRQHVDNGGEIKAQEQCQTSMSNYFIEHLKELVDADKVKIRFQFCSH
jgi:hypothetical protein